MSRQSRRKNIRTKTQNEHQRIPEKGTQAQQKDISSYFKKEDDESSSDSLRLPEGALPSPDDAALPCSTSLCSDNIVIRKSREAQKENVFEHSAFVLEGKNQKLSDTNKNMKDVPKKKRNQKQSQPFRNSQITDFYPIRRSNRKPLPKVMKEKQKRIENAIVSGNEEGFEIKDFPGKGRGIIALNPIKRGDFVLEYSGELISYEEAQRREKVYSLKENTGCYMYYFTAKNKRHCIDATSESGRLGRLVNHSKKGNLRTQPIFVGDSPHLALFAARDIDQGEELLYDYGDRSKEALQAHPWLAL